VRFSALHKQNRMYQLETGGGIGVPVENLVWLEFAADRKLRCAPAETSVDGIFMWLAPVSNW